MLQLKTINAPDEPLDEAAIHPELTPAEPSPLTRTVFEELHHGRGVTWDFLVSPYSLVD